MKMTQFLSQDIRFSTEIRAGYQRNASQVSTMTVCINMLRLN